jgi:hypothetical protein
MGGQGAPRRAALSVALLLIAIAAATQMRLDALEVEMSAPAMERALRLARFPASDADRARFHRRYIFQTSGQTANGTRLESIEIITEFRRMELIAEQHARINDLFGRSSLTEPRRELAPWRGKVYVAARVSLSGNVIAVPPIRVALDALPPLGPGEVQNIDSGDAVVGAVVAVPFESRGVGQSIRTATVTTERSVLGQVRLDFRLID